jgi:hypothetical protein
MCPPKQLGVGVHGEKSPAVVLLSYYAVVGHWSRLFSQSGWKGMRMEGTERWTKGMREAKDKERQGVPVNFGRGKGRCRSMCWLQGLIVTFEVLLFWSNYQLHARSAPTTTCHRDMKEKNGWCFCYFIFFAFCFLRPRSTFCFFTLGARGRQTELWLLVVGKDGWPGFKRVAPSEPKATNARWHRWTCHWRENHGVHLKNFRFW